MSKYCHFCKKTFWKGINGGFVNMSMEHFDGGGYRVADMDYLICMRCYDAVRTTLLDIREANRCMEIGNNE